MNRYERSEIKALIMAQLDRLTKEALAPGESLEEKLRVERLETALRRIDGENFGACFTCEEPISMSILRNNPERIICDACVEAADE
jgi:RNA polymerase-binding transcription factor DksA